MPEVEAGKTIEQLYWERVRQSPQEVRMRRAFLLFHDYYLNMVRELRRKNPEMSDREIRIAIARRLYGGDPRTVKLIKMAQNDLYKES